MTELEEFAAAVKKMRTAQQEYFRTRTPIALNHSKKLEKEVDQIVDKIIKPTPSPQASFF